MQEGVKKIVRTTKTVTKRQIVKEQSETKKKHFSQVSNVSTPMGNQQKNQTDFAQSQMSQESFKYSKSSQLGRKQDVISDAKSEIQFFTMNDYKKLQQELNQSKIMKLSDDIREKLIKLQRFDRLNYLKETQRILKQPIQVQMRRLQKIKNQKKQMRSKYFDNELTVTCLYYHHKLISQFTGQTNELQESKKSKMESDKRIYQLQTELKRQKSKQNLTVKPLQKSGSKSSVSLENQFSKQLQTSWNFSISALSSEKFPQAIKQMNFFLQKAKKSQSHLNIIKLMEQTIQIINLNSSLKDQLKKQTQIKESTISQVQLLNKYIRQQKWIQVQNLKNKINASKQLTFLSLSLLIESILQNNKKQRSASSKQKNEKIKLNKIQSSKITQMETVFKKQKKILQEQIEKLKRFLQQQKSKHTLLEQKLTKQNQKQVTKQKQHNKQKQMSEHSSTPSKVNIQQLKNLQLDFNQLSRLKEQEQYNYIKLIEEKDERIKQYQQRLSAIDKIQSQNSKQAQILTIEVQEKGKQILTLKKQLIKALQQNQQKQQNVKKPSSKVNVNKIEDKKQSQVDSKYQKQMEQTCKMLDQIIEIKKKKPQQIRGKAFELQLNTIEREQWRQVSKKIKQHKKMQPKNKFMNYIDQKHKRQFDLVQKLIDYEDKSLSIHNHVYKAISITNTVEGWWNSRQSLFCPNKTQFAKLFNKLMERLFQTYSNATFQIINKPQQKDPIQTQTTAKSNKQYIELKKQLQEICLILKKLQIQVNKNQQFLLEGNFTLNHFTILKKDKNFTHLKQTIIIIQSFLKVSFENVAKYILSKQKQLDLSKKQIQGLKLSQVNLKNQNTQISKRITILNKQKQRQKEKEKEKQKQRQKDSLQKSRLQIQKLQTQIASLKSKIQEELRKSSQFQEQTKKYSYYKELIQQQQKIVQFYLTEQETASYVSSSSYSQMTIKNKGYGNLVTTPSSKTKVNQNNKKQQTQLFLRKYPKNKVIQYLFNIRTENKRYLQEISIKEEIFQQLTTNVDYFIQNLQSKQKDRNLANFIIKQRHSHTVTYKLQQLSQIIYKQLKKIQQAKSRTSHIQNQLERYKQNQKTNEDLKRQIQNMRQTFGSIMQKLNQSKQIFESSNFLSQMYQNQIKRKKNIKLDKTLMKNQNTNKNQLNLLDTMFVLVQKISEMHLNYEGDLIQKSNQNQAKFKDQLQKIKDQRVRVHKQLDDAGQKLKTIQKQNKGLIQSESAYLQIQNSYQDLKQNYNKLLKNKNQDQSQIRQLQIFKKQLQEQKNLIDRILKGNNDQEKKQILAYKKTYPKSKFIIYADAQSKKISTYTSRISSFQNQGEKIIQFYNKFSHATKQESEWFKKDFNENLPGQVGIMFREIIKSYAKSQRQLYDLLIKMQLIQQKNTSLNQQSKQLKNIRYQIDTFSTIIQSVQKIIQKPKQDLYLFTNQFYLKNLIDVQIKKKKLNFEPIYTTVSDFVHQISSQCSNRQIIRNQHQTLLKKKVNQQKEELQKKINDLSLKCKQMEISNKQLITQNKLIKQSISKLQKSSNFLDQAKKSLQTSQRTKEYQILRLKQTIETYVKQQTRLQMQKNKIQKDRKQIQRQLQKTKKELQKLKDEHHDLKQQKENFTKMIQNLRQNSINLQNNNEQNDTIIATLKQNYSQAQRQLKSIQFRVSSLLEQKHSHLQQIKSLKNQIKLSKNQHQKQIHQLKITIQKLQGQFLHTKRQYEGLKQKTKHFEQNKKIQKDHYQQIIKKLQKQFLESSQLFDKQKKDLIKRAQQLYNQKQAITKQFDNQRVSYRQKIFQINLIGSSQNNLQNNGLKKQIQELNKKYQENIKYYQIQKQELRKYIQKINSQYQDSLIKNNSQRKKIIDQMTIDRQQERKKYQHQLTDCIRKGSQLECQVERLVGIIQSSKHNFTQILGQNTKLQKKNAEYQILNAKYQDKIGNLQKTLNQNQQIMMKLAPLQRKVRQFQSLVQIQSIISSQGNTRSILQNRLNELQQQKKNMQLMTNENNKLKFQIDKLTSQNQIIHTYSKNNRQEYLRFMTESKQNLRDIKEQNKFLIKEKNTYQNQLNKLNHLLKTMSQKQESHSQQLRKRTYEYEAHVNPMEGQLKLKINFAQIQLKQKQSQKLKLQNQIQKQKAKNNQQNQQINRIQKRNIELVSQLKQLQYRSQILQQRYNMNNTSQLQGLKKEISDLKGQNIKQKLQNQAKLNIIDSLRKDLQESRKQNHRYQFQTQSISKLSVLEVSHLKQKNVKLQEQLLQLKEKQKHTSFKIQNTYSSFSKDSQNKIRDVQAKLFTKSKDLQFKQSRIKVLQKTIKEQQREYYNFNRLIQQLQRKNQQKLKEINHLTKFHMEAETKYKQIQRNWKYFQLQTQRGLDLQKRINKQQQERIQQLQKQKYETYRNNISIKMPFSPSTSQYYEQAEQEKQKQNYYVSNLKKEIKKFELKVQELQRQNQKLRLKNHQFSIQQQHYKFTKIQTIQSQHNQTIQNLQKKNNHLTSQNSHIFNKLKIMQEQIQYQKEQIQTDKQKCKNSQRVLQHEITQYKSKLQNVEAILKQQKDKTYNLRMELQAERYKELNKSNVGSDNNMRYIHNLERQSQRYQVTVINLQKKCCQSEFQIKKLLNQLNIKQDQVQTLNRYLYAKYQELNEIRASSQETLEQIMQENIKIKQLLRMFQSNHQFKEEQMQSQNEQLNILLKISSKIQKIVIKNQQLENVSKGYKQQLTQLNKSYTNFDPLANRQSIEFYVQNVIDRLMAHIFVKGGLNFNNKSNFNNNFEKKTTTTTTNTNTVILKQFNPKNQLQINNLSAYFTQFQEYLKYLYDLILNQLEQNSIIIRSQHEIEMMKNTIRKYLQSQGQDQGQTSQLRRALQQIAGK